MLSNKTQRSGERRFATLSTSLGFMPEHACPLGKTR